MREPFGKLEDKVAAGFGVYLSLDPIASRRKNVIPSKHIKKLVE